MTNDEKIKIGLDQIFMNFLKIVNGNIFRFQEVVPQNYDVDYIDIILNNFNLVRTGSTEYITLRERILFNFLIANKYIYHVTRNTYKLNKEKLKDPDIIINFF